LHAFKRLLGAIAPGGQLDVAVAAAGVRDHADFRVAVFPNLTASRFLAAVKPDLDRSQQPGFYPALKDADCFLTPCPGSKINVG
jgi:hypothetical protein